MSEAPPSCEPNFDEVREDCIHQQHGGHQRPVGPRQWREAQGSSRPSEGQRYADRTDDDRRCDERGACAALDERDLGRPDDVNDQRLRQQ